MLLTQWSIPYPPSGTGPIDLTFVICDVSAQGDYLLANLSEGSTASTIPTNCSSTQDSEWSNSRYRLRSIPFRNSWAEFAEIMCRIFGRMPRDDELEDVRGRDDPSLGLAFDGSNANGILYVENVAGTGLMR